VAEPSELSQAAALLTYVGGVRFESAGTPNVLAEDFCGFPHFLQADADKMLQIKL
jgi:hypothetical protein